MQKIIDFSIFLFLIPACLVLGVLIYAKQFVFVSIAVAIFACIPFFINFEKRNPQPKELVLIAVLTSLVVVSRIVFFVSPNFKPVTALIIIIALAFGKDMGFMVGALTAILSNIYFGQGPWTPFQMFTWGFIGYIAGALGKLKLFNKFIPMIIFGAISGVLYSAIMSIYDTLFFDKTFSLIRYISIVSISSRVMLVYIYSNVFFLTILGIPLLRGFKRIKIKYGLFLS